MKGTRISRREFLGIGAGAAAGVALAGSGMTTFLSREAQAVTSFKPYMVSLPVPPKAVPEDGVYKISAEQFTQALHPNLPAVTVWGYGTTTDNPKVNKLYPGPTIEVHKGQETKVEFTNKLPGPHPYIPIATTAPDGSDFPGIERGTGPRILTHLHGGFVFGTSDGNPYASQTEYGTNQTQAVTYPSQPRATTLWYHDHALGMTRLNVYAGLAGFFLVRDDFDTGADGVLPGGAYEIPIVIQDKSFDANGQLFYSPDATWIPEFFGNTPVVNGAVQPFLTVEPRMYRFRFLNGSQSRFYNLELAIGDASVGPFNQIGSEGGMFTKTVQMSRILLLPAERADVIVDFRGLAGKTIELKNRSLPMGVISPATPRINSLMQFRVRPTASTPGPTSIPDPLPGSMPNDINLPASDVVKTRYITLEEVLDPVTGNPLRLAIDGRYFDDGTDADDDGVDEQPVAGTVEEWSFVNISADTHPIHMHLTNFQVLGRTPIDGAAYAAALEAARQAGTTLPNNTIDPTPFVLGPEVPPRLNERGWKDTVGANPNQITRIRQRFDVPAGVSKPEDLQYVYHCHILEHEDNDMMRPFEVKL